MEMQHPTLSHHVQKAHYTGNAQTTSQNFAMPDHWSANAVHAAVSLAIHAIMMEAAHLPEAT